MIRLKLHISKTLLNKDLPPYLSKTLLPINLKTLTKVKGSLEKLTIKDLMVYVYAQVTSMLKEDIDRSKLYFTTIDDYFLPPTASLVNTVFSDLTGDDRDMTKPIQTDPILLLTTQEFSEIKQPLRKEEEVCVFKDESLLK